ncbi:carbohydrate ABC transporter membrane protein 1 (CUT1 family) [Salisediminibacterium halotolerans]|nr:carbohydrate ABC transporter membrane protein 1 (CUT1 family) [Actinophytocola xinjiangensis]RPE85524.1 carbohydrate ABC transporter membrane protein 1 (CUT1 family) [Salisediminibacterium halotolerans]TWG33479.1 carbohydrate ABC transporter membrane protein 1 (CUT1 family) [Salisediminibacterium halotolerans]GEL07930.1 sugar ABC transporter permease [Salisediminibacterium halotolerans]
MNHKSPMTPWLFIGPAVLLLIMFSLLPILVSLTISFTDIDLIGLGNWDTIEFVGLENFINLIQDPLFHRSIFNTLIYVSIGVPLVIICSLSVALMLNYISSKLFTFFRVLFYVPSITNIVAIAVVWAFLYNMDVGLFNFVLNSLGFQDVPWLEHPFVAKISLIILAVWKGIGINMLIYLAALQSIPRSFYEAADIDGANKFQKLRFITIPSLSYATFFVTVTTLIGWLQFFEEPFVMTGGGPLDGTMSMALFIYERGFQYNEFGYAAAASLILFVFIIVATLIQFTFNKSKEN